MHVNFNMISLEDFKPLMQKVGNVIIISNCIAINMWLKLKLLGTTPSSARISPDPVWYSEEADAYMYI